MQWLMIGQPMQDGSGVVVMASNQLIGDVKIHEELSTRGGKKITVTVELDHYTQVREDTYGDALERIFNEWRRVASYLEISEKIK